MLVDVVIVLKIGQYLPIFFMIEWKDLETILMNQNDFICIISWNKIDKDLQKHLLHHKRCEFYEQFFHIMSQTKTGLMNKKIKKINHILKFSFKMTNTNQNQLIIFKTKIFLTTIIQFAIDQLFVFQTKINQSTVQSTTNQFVNFSPDFTLSGSNLSLAGQQGNSTFDKLANFQMQMFQSTGFQSNVQSIIAQHVNSTFDKPANSQMRTFQSAVFQPDVQSITAQHVNSTFGKPTNPQMKMFQSADFQSNMQLVIVQISQTTMVSYFVIEVMINDAIQQFIKQYQFQ